MYVCKKYEKTRKMKTKKNLNFVKTLTRYNF